ncbi:hypothetical protein PTTG_27181 [Puccinia triticina 1-1 BBBD Race 1]|uniref:alpha-1,2-Mannosidase n=1 Tax=Puccinia triticina (isolate 1-1 / race 1 (BBBD)) TaxID=630390 RepID=A0A180GMB9_PUCT1|nr:hypothetical protein PTTG_27181 [Puccinia triticina 1-1 BBBD Race 1]WAR64092.1 hypothetical protein PtB15_16B252 [Puccinia triticina]
MSTRPGDNMAGFADLLRSRLRALLPLGLISMFGLSIYFFFCSLTANDPELDLEKLQHPHFKFRVDGLGRVGAPDFGRAGGLIFETDFPPAAAPDLKVYEPEQLMRLPILHRTSQDPFDARNGFKPLRDSKSPWLASNPAGVMLINRLSRNRFPPAGSTDPSRGSAPPPSPPWPPRTSLKEKDHSLKTPIPKHLIAGLNTSYVWEDRDRVKDGNLPQIQWAGFDKPDWESDSDRTNRLERQGWVRRGFQHVWEGYKAKAWGHDELKPISGSFQDPFAGWGATLVDCLDTLLIMNLTHEYNYARTHVKAIDWAYTIDIHRMGRFGSYSTSQPMISFFETVIRYMGGLISAYDLSGDDLMLERAEELAEWLVPAFGTSSGLPASRYQIGSNPLGEQTGRVCIAEIGSLTLEFTRLSQLTRKGFYFEVVQKITDLLDGDQWASSSRPGTLFPTHVNPQAPQLLSGQYTFGAMADSYYEYLIKQHQLLRGTNVQYSKMYTSAIESARTHLIRTYDLESSGGKNLTVIGDISWGMFKPSLDHLTCFSGAMIGLGSQLLGRKQDLDLALGHADACVWAYESTKTGVGPERISIVEGDEHARWQPVFYEGQKFRELKSNPLPGASIQDGRYLGRPETIESVYYMWRITGDRQWQDRGWRMFTSWMEACATNFGFADLAQVNRWPPELSDKQESFVLAETFKYYYLLFSDPDLISLDDFVLNTEAHPFRLETPDKPAKRFWTGPDPALDKRYDPPGTKKGDRGFGTFLQQWSRVDLDKLSEADRQVYNRVMGVHA